jgi:hypothetical protein
MFFEGDVTIPSPRKRFGIVWLAERRSVMGRQGEANT